MTNLFIDRYDRSPCEDDGGQQIIMPKNGKCR